MKLKKKSYTKYIFLEIIMMLFGCILLSKRRYFSAFLKILPIVLFQILLHGTVQNFACNILTLKDDIDIKFSSRAF